MSYCGLLVPLIVYFILEVNKGCQAEMLQQVFRVEPENVTIPEGETAMLKCEVENPSGTVQWVKEGLLLGPNWNIPRFPRYSMTGDTSKGIYNLQVIKSQLEDDAFYECQVGPTEKSTGIISHRVQLTVLVPVKSPLFVEYEANSVVTWIAGMEYTLHCQVKDARPPAEISFCKADKELADVTSTIQPGSADKLFSTEAMLRFTPQSSDNKELLTCKAVNTVTLIPVIVSFTMNILFPPQLPVIKGYTGVVVKNKELKLTCISPSGNPLATLQWLKNDEVISRNWETDDTNQLSRSSLSLKITPEDNMAIVSCQALNQVLSLPLQSNIVLKVTFPPEQVKITGSSSTEENQEIFLTCSTSTSNPPVMLRWWLGWRELNATETAISEAEYGGMVTVSNLTYIAYREDNDLPLICEAFNEAIMYTKSASVTLRVKYPPQKIWLNVPPPETYFRAGVEIKLICFASGGNPLPRLDWYKVTCTLAGGVRVQLRQPQESGVSKPCLGKQDIKLVREGASSASSGNIISKELVLITSPSDNMATYRCNATGPPSTPPITASTSLLVQFPPLHATITATDEKVRRGQSVTLTCKSGSSNPPARLTWLQDGKRLVGTNLGQRKAEYGGFSASERVTLVVSSADHGKRVECYAYSSVLSEGVNTFYQLTVLFPPEFSPEQTHLVQAVEHGSAQLPLLVSASPPEITYRWSFLGEMILTEGSPRYHLRDGGSLEIWNVTRADAGKYRIHCENEEGQNETTITLNVHYSPSIRSIADPTYVDLGDAAEIVCQADANPLPNFQWRWLGDLERSLEDLGFKLLSEGLLATLQIQAAQRTHAGVYECQVDNGISPAAKSSARLIVRYPPEIIKGPGQRKVAASGDGRSQAALQCSAQGVPSVLFSWAKNGVSLDLQSPRYHWPGAPSFLYIDVFPPQSPTFTLTGLQPNTPYNVSVNARNALGESDFADGGAGLSITTEERIEIPVDKEPEIPFPSEPESSILPLPVVVLLGGLGGFLLVSNLFLLGCLVFRKRTQTPKGDGIEGSTRGKVRFGNSYTVSKWLKVGGQPAQLEGSSSEGSSTKTSAAVSTATTDSSVTDPNISLPWMGPQEHHEYEEVGGPRRLEDMGPLYDEWNPNDEPWINEYSHVYQGFGRRPAASTKTAPIYDSVANYLPLDTELPFEQQGELV
ncbi:PREDICTED: nephrin [Thamnophis sirtalis]|uniref:Nephrin n=1 Tax=Thamnophis sirtalis TaxID=35019 RepID=A0A6I9Z1J6_9SAUR|nr:PREDICTED: nephrin [Thamnophis sirtalis]